MIAELPLWKCHKEVRAAKITGVTPNYGGATLSTAAATIDVDMAYLTRHNPVVGGYFVAYEGEYNSFSPAKAFEEGYEPVNPKPCMTHCMHQVDRSDCRAAVGGKNKTGRCCKCGIKFDQ